MSVRTCTVCGEQEKFLEGLYQCKTCEVIICRKCLLKKRAPFHSSCEVCGLEYHPEKNPFGEHHCFGVTCCECVEKVKPAQLLEPRG